MQMATTGDKNICIRAWISVVGHVRRVDIWFVCLSSYNSIGIQHSDSMRWCLARQSQRVWLILVKTGKWNAMVKVIQLMANMKLRAKSQCNTNAKISLNTRLPSYWFFFVCIAIAVRVQCMCLNMQIHFTTEKIDKKIPGADLGMGLE